MNSSFLYLLGDCINTIACVRNTKVIQLSYILKVNKLRNTVPSAVIPIAESADKCKNRQSFWSTRLLMIQTFVFVRYLDSFSAVHLPSFEVRPAVAVRRQRSEIPLIENATAANRRHSLNARVTRVKRFSLFCLHLFTFRSYISENERFACEGFTFHRKPTIFLSFNYLGVKATAFTSTGAEDYRRHDKNGGAECPSPRRRGG